MKSLIVVEEIKGVINKLKVIIISGHARSGKDTTANIIDDMLCGKNRVLITHYADLLKYICKTFFNWNGMKDGYGRGLLQYVGTDIVRQKHPDFWVNFVANILEMFGEEWNYVIIPDARFSNEIDVLRDRGFDVTHIRVCRDNIDNGLTDKQRSHPSETALDEVIPEYYIQNNGDLNDLRKSVEDIIKEITNGK